MSNETPHVPPTALSAIETALRIERHEISLRAVLPPWMVPGFIDEAKRRARESPTLTLEEAMQQAVRDAMECAATMPSEMWKR